MIKRTEYAERDLLNYDTVVIHGVKKWWKPWKEWHIKTLDNIKGFLLKGKDDVKFETIWWFTKENPKKKRNGKRRI